ncbi:MAG TPA: hypothetical protein PKV71_18360, partial [Calditrichia bacterium]|nr:hypothetical protein [Calditrichia bacterium]
MIQLTEKWHLYFCATGLFQGFSLYFRFRTLDNEKKIELRLPYSVSSSTPDREVRKNPEPISS